MPILTTFKDEGSAPVKVWTTDIEESALKQLHNLSTLPFIHKHIAVMPDVHWGMGSTVGSVVPTIKAIVPAAVGVDIGCGMVAHKLSVRPDQLPDGLGAVRSALEKAIPHGRTDEGGPNDRGAWGGGAPSTVTEEWGRLSADRGYHWSVPRYEGQEAQGCDLLPGGKCYYDGSGLNAGETFKRLLNEGSDGVWKDLEEFYHELSREKAA